LIAHLRKSTDPLLGALQESGPEEAWLTAWASLAAHRNRQSHAYRASISGLLQREGWALQESGPDPSTDLGAHLTAELRQIRDERRTARSTAILSAPLLTTEEAATLQRRRQTTPEETAALDRFRLAQRWALGDAPPSPELVEADRDGLLARLRLGWLLTTPEAWGLAPTHDWLAIARLDSHGRPFAPDRSRVALTPKVAPLMALGIPALLARFAAGETIAATDPAVVALHVNATAHRCHLKDSLDVTPGKLPTGTLRTLLRAVGWSLKRAGRIKTRTEGERDACTYTAERVAIPSGVDPEALAGLWLAELRQGGAKNDPMEKPHRVEKCPSAPPRPMPGLLQGWAGVPIASIPWPSGPPRPRPCGFRVPETAHQMAPGGIQ
jgi:hypothetical protein